MEPAAEIKNLSVVLGGKVKALDNVSIDLPRGKTIGVIGPSGAGKTTLIRSLVGRIRPAGGSISVFGLRAGSPELRHRVSYMTQELAVYPDLTVLENLNYFAAMAGTGKKEIVSVVNTALKTVDLTGQAGSLVANLSGGQKQRVSLAVALLGSPELMVLDEPTVGLDPVLRDKLWRLFNELSGGGTTLIISSHSMDEAERCDDLVLIRDGAIIAHCPPAKLKLSTGTKTIEQSFLKLVGVEE